MKTTTFLQMTRTLVLLLAAAAVTCCAPKETPTPKGGYIEMSGVKRAIDLALQNEAGELFGSQWKYDHELFLQSDAAEIRLEIVAAGSSIQAGTYTCAPLGTETPNTFGGSANDASNCIIIASGTMKVEVSGKRYTITIDAADEEGGTVKVFYEGEIPGGSYESSATGYVDTQREIVGAYFLHDPANTGNVRLCIALRNRISMFKIDFHCPAGTATLPAGTYTYSSGGQQGTFDIDGEVTSGTITVGLSGSTYSIEGRCDDDDGIVVDLSLSGTIGYIYEFPVRYD